MEVDFCVYRARCKVHWTVHNHSPRTVNVDTVRKNCGLWKKWSATYTSPDPRQLGFQAIVEVLGRGGEVRMTLVTELMTSLSKITST
jgi:ribulose-5-phosphate 4-epimerase/fuculose-1-phosphate aldolase